MDSLSAQLCWNVTSADNEGFLYYYMEYLSLRQNVYYLPAEYRSGYYVYYGYFMKRYHVDAVRPIGYFVSLEIQKTDLRLKSARIP